jgi:hypothetical protein
MGTVTIHELRFTEDEIAVLDESGNVSWYTDPPQDEDHLTTTVHEGISAREAAALIKAEGLTFSATGNDWAANPEGSYVSNYATGERCETSAHLSGFPDRVVNAIIEAVESR